VEWEITFASDPEIMTIRAWGPASMEGVQAYFQEAVSRPEWKPGISCLLDFRDLDLAKFSTEQLQTLATFFDTNKKGVGAAFVSIVVTRSVEYGVARMWTALSEDVGMHQRVFYALEEGTAWLASVSRVSSRR
jgi:hypothetical protein